MHAILLSADECRHVNTIRSWRKYLEDETRARKVTVINPHICGESNVLWKIKRALEISSDDPLLFIYCGHGSTTGWNPSHSAPKIDYTWLVSRLAPITSPVLLVNDCCHAYALVHFLENSPQCGKRSVIAACSADETSEVFSLAVCNAWREREAYESTTQFCGTIDGTYTELETVAGGWQELVRHKMSLLLHKMAPTHFSIRPLHTVILLTPNESPKSGKEDEPVELRYGETLDHFFFTETPPLSVQLRLPLSRDS